MAQTRRDSSGRDALRIAIKGLNGATGKVGWFESAKYPDGTPVAGVAAVQEFGNVHTPPRLGMRQTQSDKQGTWKGIAKDAAKAVVTGELPPGALMEAVCLQTEGDLRATISKVLSPPLKRATIRARERRSASGEASTKPLVDTGYMLATLTSQTTKK